MLPPDLACITIFNKAKADKEPITMESPLHKTNPKPNLSKQTKHLTAIENLANTKSSNIKPIKPN
jgi:hypothetical protein